MDQRIGNYSFAVGVIIALILGLAGSGLSVQTNTVLTSLLVILGIIVGLVNVTGKETKEFLIVATVLIIASALGGGETVLGQVGFIGNLNVGQLLSNLLNAVLVFTVPAVVVVAIKQIWGLEKSK